MNHPARPLLCTAFLISALVGSLDAQRTTLRERMRERREGRSRASASTNVDIEVQGTTRHYLLHLPAEPDGALVLAFHGGGETPGQQEEMSGFDALADHEHFIVAYPEGIGKSWNDGRGTTTAAKQGVDDVGFAKAIVADIAKAHTIDRARVFATGPSNGGIFVNRLGCDAADTFIAIAPVIGTIATALAPNCHPSAPIAVVGIQGVADPVVPFGGGAVGGTLEGAAAVGDVQGSRATQELWRTLNGCASSVTATSLPVVVRDGTTVDTRAFGGCRANADVVWYEIQGGGHRWPPHHADGIVEHIAERKLGVSSRNINASDVIWAFFAAHPRR